ncbi:MAG: DNA-methyltransferase [Promethearchaeota archaeon]
MKIKIHNPDNLKCISYKRLMDLQDDFKSITSEALKKLKKSITTYGIFVPKFVWINKDIYWTIDGHQTKKALSELENEGYEIPEIPIVEVKASNKKDAIKKLLIINSRYGKINRKTNIFDLYDLDLGDLITTLEIPEIDFNDLIKIEETSNDDDIAEEINHIVKSGDLIRLGNHFLLCGDASDGDNYCKLLNDSTIDLVVTDPPYNVDYSSKNELLNLYYPGNRIQKDIINDRMDFKNYQKWLINIFGHILSILSDYNAIYVFGNCENLISLYNLKELKISNFLVWIKNSLVLGRQDYKGKHEFICYGWKKHHKWYGSRNQSTVLEFDKPIKSDLHPTMKPIDLLVLLIMNSSKIGMKVFDPFMGSGSTLIACEKTNRICYGFEIDPFYCDVIIERYRNWMDQNGKNYEIFINDKKIL